jgi:large subunit ribosomal protein L21
LIDVERLDIAEGKAVELDRVLLIADGDKITAGTPVVDGAKVMATAQGNGKDKKITVFKYKSKTRYHKKTGHRQPYTRLTIDKILTPGAEEAKPVKKRARRTKKEETADGA